MLVLSTLSPDATVNAILSGDVKKIQSVKGIGLKTAQRILVDLRDKLSKLEFAPTAPGQDALVPQLSRERQEAVSALVTLGFAKASVEKTVDGLLAAEPDSSTEDIIKKALRML